MTCTTGQRDAFHDLESIAQWGDALEIIKVREPQEEGASLFVEIALSFKGVPRSSDGIPLRQRERFFVLIPSTYPFHHPFAFVPHQRWASWPHVQWTCYLCLYQASDTEWDPSDGMFGFIERLYKWVKQAAINQLDPNGAPLHPPVAYVNNSAGPLVIPYANTPAVGDRPWLGFGCIDERTDSRIDVTGWCESNGNPTGTVAAAVLLPRAASFEFPSKVRDLLTMLEDQGVARNTLISVLGQAATLNGDDSRLLVLVGTPTRGIRGSASYQQNLVAWLVEPMIANGFRLALEQFSPYAKLQEIGRKCERLVFEWSEQADVCWCYVREARPEVTVRRDEDSPLAWFRDKTVVVWGCGAIGGHVAEALARAGVKKIILRDKSVVTPGVLVRQLFEDSDIGKNKAVATRERLLRIIPSLSVEAIVGDLLRLPVGQATWPDDADLVINATASWPVAQHLEACRASDPTRRTVIASMVLGHHTHRALLYVAKAHHSGASADLARKTKIEVLKRDYLSPFADDFWPSEPVSSFQPEPGCSEPTFVGSQAEVMGHVGTMLSKLARELTHAGTNAASSHLFAAPGVNKGSEECREYDFYFDRDVCLTESLDGYSIRIAPQALASLRSWVRRSERRNGPHVETGGHLFGERNEVARVIWVTNVSGPPPDSKASPSGFVCGTKGVAKASERNSSSSGGAVRFIGMWHTHPQGSPKPSKTDYDTMNDIVHNPSFSCPRSLLLVIGTTSKQESWRATATLFSRGRLPSWTGLVRAARPVALALPSKSKLQGKQALPQRSRSQTATGANSQSQT